MLHKRYEYRGVIVGMDPVCQADERWQRVRPECRAFVSAISSLTQRCCLLWSRSKELLSFSQAIVGFITAVTCCPEAVGCCSHGADETACPATKACEGLAVVRVRATPVTTAQAMGIHRLPHGGQQPFYHVLVDERDRPGTHTTYVAQARWAGGEQH